MVSLPSGALIFLTSNRVGRGINAPCWATIAGIDGAAIWKVPNATTAPFLLANEIVCYRLGQAVGLPIASSFVYSEGGRDPAFIQMNFNKSGGLLPPLSPAQCADAVKELPRDTARLVAFDAWVMNTDRHAGNLAYRPKTLFAVYDHSHALFGAPGVHTVGAKRFPRTDWLGCDGDPANRHCLLDHLTDAVAISEAVSAVQAVGDAVLKGAFQEARGHGLSSEDSNRGLAALQRRRDRLRAIVDTNRKQFKGVQQWDLRSVP